MTHNRPKQAATRPGRHRACPNLAPDRQSGRIIEEDYGLDVIEPQVDEDLVRALHLSPGPGTLYGRVGQRFAVPVVGPRLRAFSHEFRPHLFRDLVQEQLARSVGSPEKVGRLEIVIPVKPLTKAEVGQGNVVGDHCRRGIHVRFQDFSDRVYPMIFQKTKTTQSAPTAIPTRMASPAGDIQLSCFWNTSLRRRNRQTTRLKKTVEKQVIFDLNLTTHTGRFRIMYRKKK